MGARGRTEGEERRARRFSTTLASQSLRVGTAFSTAEAAKTILLFPRGHGEGWGVIEHLVWFGRRKSRKTRVELGCLTIHSI